MDHHTPHPTLTERRLALIHDKTLARAIRLRRTAGVPDERLTLVGLPPLAFLEAERPRRESGREAAAS